MWAGEVREDAEAVFGPVSGFKETADQKGILHKKPGEKKRTNKQPQNTDIIIIYRLGWTLLSLWRNSILFNFI